MVIFRKIRNVHDPYFTKGIAMTTDPTKKQLIWFYGVTFGLAWVLGPISLFLPGWSPLSFWPPLPHNLLATIAGYAPALAALGLTAILIGRPGLKQIADRLTRWQFHPVYYLLILVGLPACAMLISGLVGLRPDVAGMSLAALPLFIVQWLLSPVGLSEEIGWRWFALPRWRTRYSAFGASLVLGAISALWYAPAFFLPALIPGGIGFGSFVFVCISVSIIATWLYYSSGESLLATTLFRIVAALVPALTGLPWSIWALLLVVMAMAVIARTGPEHLAQGDSHSAMLSA
jgi:membrane protease YdiL (CAAX protease family)